MMEVQMVDLAEPAFWVIFGVAVFLLTPLNNAVMRKWELAGVNVAFLVWLTGWQAAIAVAGAAAVWLVAKIIMEGKRSAGAIAKLALAAMLILFLIHKMPWLAAKIALPFGAGKWTLGVANPLLAAIGYSYIVMRAIDMLRAMVEKRGAAPDFPSTINYLMPFHMLAAGPIQAWDEFVTQPANPAPLTPAMALRACERIAWGLFKKFVLAYAIKSIFLTQFRADGWYFILEANLFAIYMFLDFSALSDIAVGVGRLIGVATPENFNRPYFARNLINFWERWHISLSQWIRRNLFIPIQLAMMRGTGGTHALLCASVAFMASFLICGLWHGIDVGFFIWGACHALGLVVTNLYRHWLTKRLGAKGVKEYMKSWPIRIVAIILTFEYTSFATVPIGYVMAGSASFGG